jgi:SnoaL-like protein
MNDAKEVVLSYIRALDSQDYDAARGHLNDDVRVKGPAGEMFSKPKEFIDMLRSYRGKYDLKKVFTDGNDVCLLYDLKTPTATVFMCSWYHVNDGKIDSIQTVFDPRPFGPPRDKKSA